MTLLQFGTVKRLAAVLIALVIVLAAGAVIGQAPELFGAEVGDDPQASIEFEDQTGDGTEVTVANVSLSEGGFVVITDGDGEIAGVSGYLEAEAHENVTVERHDDDAPELRGQLTATAHRDTTDNETFTYNETGGEEDFPYVERGHAVSDTATVTTADRPDDEAATGSFLVESVRMPGTVGVNETLGGTAEIRNPNDFGTSQEITFRLDGRLLERRILELEPEESREIEFEISLEGESPGVYTAGVYTVNDGQLQELRIEGAGPATLAPLEADATSVTVNASLPAGGFVAAENDTGDVIATSDDVEPGPHENVTLTLGEAADPGENVTLVAYRGSSDDIEAATAYAADGERVAVDVTLEESALEQRRLVAGPA